MRRPLLLFLLSLLLFLVACGGSSTDSVTPTQLKLNLTTASTLVGQTQQFTANIPVTWAVKEQNGGAITSNGLYTAPRSLGVFHVMATAVSDTSQTATATVNVSAKFGHLQEIPNGATPYSVTPIMTTIAPDGTLKSANVMDTSTNKPVDTQMEDVTISPDGTKAVFTQLTYDIDLEEEYQAIWIANTDATSVRQLTFPSSTMSYGNDRYPSFTPDGKSVIYSHQDNNGSAEANTSYSIRLVGIDGSNKQILFEGNPAVSTGISVANPYIWHASLSPDGTTIAAEVAYSRTGDGMNWVDGIATLATSGPSIVQLTGDPAAMGCINGYAYDEMPAYSPDGSKIVFSRLCDSETAMTETILSMDATTGASLTQLHGSPGLISCQPRALANQIVFSSNVDNPATDWFDIYLMNVDGSSLQRVSNNTLYDGFSIWWMNGNYSQTSDSRVLARAKKISPMQQRLDHIKQLREHRKQR